MRKFKFNISMSLDGYIAGPNQTLENPLGEGGEQLARICELAHRLGFNDAKTKMLIGQSAGDLAGLERKLSIELDDQPERKSAENGDVCAWQNLAAISLPTGSFAMQPTWSNAISGCAMSS